MKELTTLLVFWNSGYSTSNLNIEFESIFVSSLVGTQAREVPQCAHFVPVLVGEVAW